MDFYSTNNHNKFVTLHEAVIHGLASDQGLYMPANIPKIPSSFFESIDKLSFEEISYYVASQLIGNDLPHEVLFKIVSDTIQFDAPLVKIEDDIYALELFHGPTLAFKDFGARFLSGMLGYFSKEQNQKINILVATSGDTGSAVANGFLGVDGTQVIVLYPSGKVSNIQEKQFTTLGKNIIALEVDGSFDDCQRLVKQSFSDIELNKKYFLTSANSINIARLIPQSFYYFYAYSRIKQLEKDVIFSVPSGNFGNITAGLLAKKMGLPIKKFIAATNVNKVVPDYLKSKEFIPRPSISTLSNAMDVGNPSNFPRMLDLYNHNFQALSFDVIGDSFSDDDTMSALKEVYSKYDYIMDPHGAIGYLALKKHMLEFDNAVGIFLETAHPAKFNEVVEKALTQSVTIPERLNEYIKREKSAIRISADFKEFKSMLPSLIT
jgi:threonine synthase